MKKVFVLVEGQTEELFVAELLRPALRTSSVELVPVLLKTKRLRSGGHYRGGVTTYASARRDASLLLGDASAVMVTTMLDLYGLPPDFPGFAQRGRTAVEWAENVERAWKLDLQDERFHPYLSVHEFEAFAFVAPEQCTTVFTPEQARRLREVGEQFGGRVEDINDGPRTHPAARVSSIRPGYEKPIHGALIAIETGLDRLEAASPHFAAFLKHLRQVGLAPA